MIAGAPPSARTLARAIVAGEFGDRPTLLAATISSAFAQRLHRALKAGRCDEEFASWLARTCENAPLDSRVTAMLAHACAAAGTLVSAETRDGALAEVARAVAAALARVRAPELPPRDAEDEVDAAIAAFVARLDDNDPLSAEHSRAVSLWCRRIAAHMNLEPEQVRHAARCGMIHDVGKAVTPKEILLAPRALTEAEWRVMRDHTVAGARMIAESARLQPFVTAVRSHHERLDGKGYPDRLSAREIPLEVRIVTVADSFNAMIGRRPYRLPFAPAHALEQLHAHRGTQFDPLVAEAAIAIVRRTSPF